MKTVHYKIPVSQRFLSGHPRAGQNTYFAEKIQLALSDLNGPVMMYADDMTIVDELKFHTIRNNFELWNKRIHKVSIGKAVIDLCYWKLPGGRFTPGNDLITFVTFDKDSGCGVQKIILKEDLVCASIETSYSYNLIVSTSIIADNDGLSHEDFKAWFKGYDLSEPMAIIHFTSFRY